MSTIVWLFGRAFFNHSPNPTGFARWSKGPQCLRLRIKAYSTSTNGARNVASRILLDEFFSERYADAPKSYGSPVRGLQYLGTVSRHEMPLHLRLSQFRDIIGRSEVEAYAPVLEYGISRALRGPNLSQPQEVLRQGEDLAETISRKFGLSSSNESKNEVLSIDDLELPILQGRHGYQPPLAERRRILREFNAFLQRLRNRGFSVPYLLAAQGLHLAAEGHSGSSLRVYCDMITTHTGPVSHIALEPWVGATLSSLRLWLSEDDFYGWEGARRKDGISSLLVASTQAPVSARATHPPLRSLCLSLPANLRGNYLYLLQYFDGPRGVLTAWKEFQASTRWDDLMESQDEQSKHELALILHDVVEYLIIAGAPQMAWLVVRGMNWKPHLTLAKTWSLLLDFPKYLTQMSDGMQEVLLQKYEEQIQRIEEMLGVKWTGGEKGTHVYIEASDDLVAESERAQHPRK